MGDIRRVRKHKLNLDRPSLLVNTLNFIPDFISSEEPYCECLISRLDSQLSGPPISSRKFQGRCPITRHLLYY
jgi:hypothetical protein